MASKNDTFVKFEQTELIYKGHYIIINSLIILFIEYGGFKELKYIDGEHNSERDSLDLKEVCSFIELHLMDKKSL